MITMFSQEAAHCIKLKKKKKKKCPEARKLALAKIGAHVAELLVNQAQKRFKL